MFNTLIVVAALVTSTPVAPVVRPQNDEAARLLTHAASQSPVVREQLERLAASDVVVMLSTITPASKDRARWRGQTQLLTSTASQRLVLVRVRIPDINLVATLAHELQHALEIAASDARTQADVEALFKRIGRDNGNGQFETDAALAAERAVTR